MPCRFPLTTGTALALGLLTMRPCAVRAEDPPPADAPAPSPERATALAKAEEASARARESYVKGEYEAGAQFARTALDLRQRALGNDDPEVATSLYDLARILLAQGFHKEARSLYERALLIRERSFGPDHLAVAQSLSGLARILDAQGAYAEARPLFERSLAIYERSLGGDHPDVATGLSNLAGTLRRQGAYTEARPMYERALAIRVAVFGDAHPVVAQSLNNLAVLLQTQGAYGEARAMYARALSTSERAQGKNHPDVATYLLNLAKILRELGNLAEARPLIERALSILEKALGKDHPDVANGLNNFALLLDDAGATSEARPLYERALAIREKALGKDHPDVAESLNNLGEHLRVQGAFSAARPLLERALSIDERIRGKDHPLVATTLNNLALVIQAQGANREAQVLYERALSIREKAFGPDHPDVAISLHALGRLLQSEGALAQARPLIERALSIREKAFGVDHPDVAGSLNNLASLLRAQGEYAEARPFFERALAMTERLARAHLQGLSALQRLGLLRSARYQIDSWLMFAPLVNLSGYSEVLRLRGLVGRTETAERTLSRHASSDARLAQESLQAAARRAARLANEVPSSFKPEVRAAWQKAYGEANAEREKLTLDLTKKVASMRVALERLDLSLADVQAQVGPDTALVDFLRVKDRYLAWVVRGSGEPIRIDVGASDAIEKASGAFLDAITHGQDSADAGSTLRSLVWTPIADKLEDGVKRVVICPDAALAALPFAALPGKAPGTNLLDDLAMSYVMNAQDLVPWKDAPPAGTGALVVGGVDYDHADGGPNDVPASERPVALGSIDRAPRGDKFDSLPQTKVEAEALRDRLGKETTTLRLGAQATESRLRVGAKGRRFVHIATHGFAREDLLAGLYSRKIEEAFMSADAERQLAAGHDPMLLSGLAMAGANPRDGADGDDGILTALEASYLDLDGVDLVTLSACETARGTAESGEGVQGLVSAFQMAGARRVVASLWRVDDEATRRLMEGLYERMLRKDNPLSPSDALRESALALRAWKDSDGKARFAAPKYWAAFVAYGR